MNADQFGQGETPKLGQSRRWLFLVGCFILGIALIQFLTLWLLSLTALPAGVLTWLVSAAVAGLIAAPAVIWLVVVPPRRGELALRRSEQRFRGIFDQTHQFIGLMSTEGVLLEANRSALDFAGLKEQDVIGRPFWETAWWTHSAELQEQLKRAVATAAAGELVRFNANHEDADGKLHHVDFSLKPVKNESGKVVFLIPEGYDVSARQRAEEDLRDREAKLATIVNHTHEVLYIHDTNHRLTYMSPYCQEIFGFTPEQMMIDWTTLITDSPVNQRGFDLTELAIATGQKQDPYLLEIIRKDGQTRWIEANESPVKDEDGKVVAISGCLRDVTDRKKNEEALRESERRFRQLANATWEAIVVHEHGLIVEANDLYFQMFGYRPEELAGADAASRTVTPESYEVMRHNFFTGNLGPYEVTGKKKTGEEFPIEIRVRMMDYHGRQVRVAAIRDLSEQKRIEEALRAGEERLSSIFRASPIGIGVVQDRVIMEINDRACEMVGRTRDELIGQTARVLYLSDEDFEFVGREKYRQIGLEGSGTVETQWKHTSGEILDILLSSAPIDPDDLSVGVTFTALDITERKRAEQTRLEQAQAERLLLRELDHRVRNNLTSLITLIDLSRNTATSTEELADSIRNRTQALATVHSLLSSGKWHAVPLRKLVETLIQPMHGTRLLFEGPEVVVPLAQAQALGIVINELATNSLKYGSMSVVGGEVNLTWETLQQENSLGVTLHWVEANGPELDAEPRPGVGTGLIQGLVRSELRGEVQFRYTPHGVHHTLHLNLQELTTARLEPPAKSG